MKRFVIVLTAVFITIMAVIPAAAQEQPQLICVAEHVIHPDRVAEHDKVMAEWKEVFTRYKIKYGYQIVSSDDIHC